METKSFDDIKQMFVQIAENHKRIDGLVAKTQIQLAETDRQVKETARQMKETDRKMQEADKRLSHKVDQTYRKLDAMCDRVAIVSDKVDKVAYLYGGMANNRGAAVETFYFNTLKDDPVLDDMKFEKVYKNLTARYRGIEDEFNIVLVNCEAVFLIEVKHKASQQDIERLIQTKASKFPRLMTQYADYKLYLGMACFTIEQPVKDSALAQGVYILERKGDVIVSATP